MPYHLVRHLSNICVVGGGVMGAGVAQVSAQNGYNVTVVDSDESSQKCMVQVRIVDYKYQARLKMRIETHY